MQHILSKNRHQIEFTSLDDLIEADNTVRFVDAFVDKLELNKNGSLKICYSYNLNNKLRLYFTNPFFENQFEIGVFSQPDVLRLPEVGGFRSTKLSATTKLDTKHKPTFNH